ncbi:MAG: hypothetical protein PVJ53_11260 [Desulfobacterales bacterium]|jgi:hypothetical protein
MELAYREMVPGRSFLKRAYLRIILWFMGRAVQAASRVDERVRREIETLPDQFTFALGILPAGPYLVVQKIGAHRARYLGGAITAQPVDLTLAFKHLEAGMLTFTFRENTPVATARDRLIVDGEVANACTVVRILDIVQVYLLPKVIAKLAVKRYPRWPLGRKLINRVRIYLRTIIGY